MARILIVDTQTDLRHTLVRLLEQAGQSTTAVATVAEAASILAVDVPDLLATDVVLTDGSSTSLAKQAETAGAKTLMMTGSPDRIVEFDGSGQPYLSKPFPPEAFLQRVEHSFRRAEPGLAAISIGWPMPPIALRRIVTRRAFAEKSKPVAFGRPLVILPSSFG